MKRLRKKEKSGSKENYGDEEQLEGKKKVNVDDNR